VIFAVDFDGTIVSMDRRYDDVTSPLRFLPGARAGLLALRRAGHHLLLWSARASPALLDSPELDPLVRAGVTSRGAWEKMLAVNRARHRQMLEFVERELPGVFAAVDDGRGGKPVNVDVFLDDRAVRLGRGAGAFSWREVARSWGEPAQRRSA